MRWPWQRAAEQRTDAAAPAAPARASVPDAAPPVPPAGWAFLPPLQRQVSDAPPAVLRPAFVSTLPTRTVPASLGTMGHLVDDHAPAGTVAVDGGALGAPVQRAIASELTLRPGRVEARPMVARSAPVGQRSTDAAGPLPLEEPPAMGPRPAEAALEEPALEETALGEPALEEAAPAEPLSSEAQASVEDHAVEHGVEAANGVEPEARPTAGPRAADTAGATGGRGLIGEGAAVTVSRLAEEPTRPASGFAPDVASPPLEAPRRAGLGAPLPTTPLQRSAAEADRATPSPPRPPRPAAPVAQRSAEAATLSVEPRESPEPEPEPESEAEARPEPGSESYVPLLAEAPIALTTAADTSAPRGGDSVSEAPAMRSALGETAPLARPSPTGVQREFASEAESDADIGHRPSAAEPRADTEPRADAEPRADTEAAPIAAAAPAASPYVTAPVAQRSVALVADRRIVPSLGVPTGGATPGPPRGRVVVARVVAPQPPAPPAGEATSARPSTTAMPPRAQGSTVGVANASPTEGRVGGALGGAAAEDSWASETAAVVASVARLTTAPISSLGGQGGPRQVGADEPPREPMPVAAVAAPAAAAAAAVQRSIELGAAGSATRPSGGADAATTSTPWTTTAIAPPSDADGTADVVVQSAPAPTSATAAPGSPAAAPENVEQLVRKLYGPLVRRIKAELLLDRERRGIRIDGI